MQIILFTLVAAALYVVSDSIVKAIEKHRGEVLQNRSIIFFIIIMTLALVTFNLIETYGPEVGLLPEPTVQQETTKPGDGN